MIQVDVWYMMVAYTGYQYIFICSAYSKKKNPYNSLIYHELSWYIKKTWQTVNIDEIRLHYF